MFSLDRLRFFVAQTCSAALSLLRSLKNLTQAGRFFADSPRSVGVNHYTWVCRRSRFRDLLLVLDLRSRKLVDLGNFLLMSGFEVLVTGINAMVCGASIIVYVFLISRMFTKVLPLPARSSAGESLER